MTIDDGKNYTAREAAAFLKKTEATVKKYCRLGKIKGTQVGLTKQWHVTGAEILSFGKKLNIF